MTTRIADGLLRRLRNDIPIDWLIEHRLQLPCKRHEGIFRFLCPLCGEFHTATSQQSNLARCFRCEKSLNPIDLVVAAEKCSFLDAVALLEPLLSAARPAESRGS